MKEKSAWRTWYRCRFCGCEFESHERYDDFGKIKPDNSIAHRCNVNYIGYSDFIGARYVEVPEEEKE